MSKGLSAAKGGEGRQPSTKEYLPLNFDLNLFSANQRTLSVQSSKSRKFCVYIPSACGYVTVEKMLEVSSLKWTREAQNAPRPSFHSFA